MRQRFLKRIFVFAVSCIFQTACIFSAESVNAGEHHFIWKVHTETSTVYLLGSIHAAQTDMYPLADPIMQAYRNSQVLVVEANLEKSDSGEIQQKMLEAAASDQPLQEQMPSDLFDQLNQQFSQAGMSLDVFFHYHPWFAALQLTMLRIQQLGFDPSIGIDHYFIQKAVQSGREIQELESAFSQIQILSSLSPSEEQLFVQYSLEGMEGLEESLKKLKGAWMRGDDRLMAEEIIDRPLREDPAIRPIFDKLFFERNQLMVQKIEGYLQSGKIYFVVVGSGHLVGKGGILDLLVKQGFLPEQL